MKVKVKEKVILNDEIFYKLDRSEFINAIKKLIDKVGPNKKYYVLDGAPNRKRYYSLGELLEFETKDKTANIVRIAKSILLQLNQMWKK